MTDRLECDDCGTLNLLMAKHCSLCGASLEEEEARRREGDPRIMLAVAVLSTIVTATVSLAAIAWFTVMRPRVGYFDFRVAALWLVVAFFLGTVSVGFWKGYLRAHRARKKP